MTSVVVLVIAGVLVVTGIVLIRWGLRPSRRGSTPYCKTCGYNLTGSTADRCSECGTVLGQAQIVYGERRKKPVFIRCGILLILLTSVPLFVAARRINWYQLRPTAWVIGDFRTSTAADQKRAWDELTRRFEAEKLIDNYAEYYDAPWEDTPTSATQEAPE
jgi:hypothetical protein